jgi:DNA-binding MarR family transcriptional regulator
MAGMADPAQPLDIGILLAAAYQEFVRELRADLAERGFADSGRSDGYVLRALAGGPMTVSTLADRLEITKQGAGQLVEGMEQRGYVERQPDPDDRRARLVALSGRGQEMLRAARRFHQRYERHLVNRHGAEPVAMFRALLGAVAGTAAGGDDPRLRAFYI